MTSTPWRVSDPRDSGWMENSIYVCSQQGNIVRCYDDYGNAGANAQLIVHRVNTYEQREAEIKMLVEALTRISNLENNTHEASRGELAIGIARNALKAAEASNAN